jgi:hypothetical protein
MNAPINPLLYSLFTPAVCQAVEVEAQYAPSRERGCIASFKEEVLQPVIDKLPFINHWKRVMYLALLKDF